MEIRIAIGNFFLLIYGEILSVQKTLFANYNIYITFAAVKFENVAICRRDKLIKKRALSL
jgi:hypothetical protein